MPDSAPSFEYADAADRLFADIADPQARLTNDAKFENIWCALHEMMFPAAWVAEDDGGAGLSATDVGQIVEAAGRYALVEPLVETILARHWAARAGLDLPDEGPILFAPLRQSDVLRVAEGGILQGSLHDISAQARELVAVAESDTGLMLVHLSLRAPQPSSDVQALCLDGLKPQAAAPLLVPLISVHAAAATIASAWIAGALRGLLTMAVAYAGEREAFGRKIAKFQAIQHHIAHLATEVASAEVSARVALQAIEAGGGVFEAAAAKVRADEAGRVGCRIAHQVFGAIGFTIEHPLHLYTNGIETWRNRYGTGPEWAVMIGRAAFRQGGPALWPSLTAPDALGQTMGGPAHA